MTDVLIIGAGPAGSTSAAFLVQRGFDVLVLEKQKFPRFSIGESLLPMSMQMIEKAGMKEAVLSAGFQYKNGASFVYGGKHYEFNFANKSTPGYEWIFEVPRAEFDHLLINEAERMGAKVRYEVEIVKAEFPDGKPVITVKTKDGKTEVHKPKFVFDASGFGRVLPKLLELETPSTQPTRIAWYTQVFDHILPHQFDRQKIRVTIHPKHRDIWYWLIPFSNGKSSMGVVGPEELLKSYKGTNEERLWQLHREDPVLGELLKNAKPAMPVGELRGYSANVKKMWGPGFVLLGNAAEFLDPVFSSGVCIAMKSADLATDCLARQFKGEAVNWDKEFAEPLKLGVETFRGFVDTWYTGDLADIFFHHKKDPKLLRYICSVLAGYAWDTSNPYVGKSKQRLVALAHACRTNPEPATAAA